MDLPAGISPRFVVSSEGSSQAPYLPGLLNGRRILAPALALQKRLSSMWLFRLIARYLSHQTSMLSQATMAVLQPARGHMSTSKC